MKGKVIAVIALTLILAIPIVMSYAMNIEQTDQTVYKTKDTTNISSLINNSSQNVYVQYTGVSNNKDCYDGYKQTLDFKTLGSTYTSVPVYNTILYTDLWNVTADGYYGVPDNSYWFFQSTNHYIKGYSYVNSEGNTVYGAFVETAPAANIEVYRSYDGYYIGGTVLPLDITDLKIQIFHTPVTISFHYMTFSGYAYPAGGWHAPNTPGILSGDGHYWYNGQRNQSVTMIVDLKETSQTWLQIDREAWGNNCLYLEKEASGNVHLVTTNYTSSTVDTADLGNYEYVKLIIEKKKVTVSGLSKWPSFNEPVTEYNKIEMEADFTFNSAGFEHINFIEGAGNTGINLYRVDSAYVRSATYPTVSNATISPINIKPDLTNSQVKISKIGLYGSSIVFGGETFTVNDGNITLGGKQVKVEDMEFRSTTDDGITWDNTINGYHISDTASISTIQLNGTWSAIYNLSGLDAETVKVSEWKAGSFGYDMDWFALVGLISCAAVTVALGLYGRRSGTKMLWLMLVSGGAALIFFFML